MSRKICTKLCVMWAAVTRLHDEMQYIKQMDWKCFILSDGTRMILPLLNEIESFWMVMKGFEWVAKCVPEHILL